MNSDEKEATYDAGSNTRSLGAAVHETPEAPPETVEGFAARQPIKSSQSGGRRKKLESNPFGSDQVVQDDRTSPKESTFSDDDILRKPSETVSNESNQHRRKDERRAMNPDVRRSSNAEDESVPHQRACSISDDENNVGHVNLLFDSESEPGIPTPPPSYDSRADCKEVGLKSSSHSQAHTQQLPNKLPTNADLPKFPKSNNKMNIPQSQPASGGSDLSRLDCRPEVDELDNDKLNGLDKIDADGKRDLSPLSNAASTGCFPSLSDDRQPLLLEDTNGESSLRIISEIVVPFLLAGLGCVFAGIVLDIVKVCLVADSYRLYIALF